MRQEFKATDLIEAALQRKGASKKVIQDFLAKLESLATSKEDFDKWNRVLDDEGVKMLTFMISEKGGPYCDMILDVLFKGITDHYDITSEELVSLARLN